MKYNFLKYTLAVIASSCAVAACTSIVDIDKDWDPDNVATGAPTVRKIAASADTTVAITTASLNQPIAVFGNNLCDLVSVTINDIDIDLSEVYAKSHRLELVIPRKLPGEVNNKLHIVTKLGETTADLNVTLPKLVINGFENDFAADTDTVKVVGSNFDLYQIDSVNAKLNFNGTPIKMIDCSATYFSIAIPAGTATDATSYLTVETPNVKTPVSIPFREAGIPILTNDSRTWNGGWWPTGIINMGSVNPEKDYFYNSMFQWVVYIKKNFPGTWGYENVMITHFWLDNDAADILANPENWCVKFEIANPSGTPLARYIRIGAAETESAGKLYMWDPASSNNGIALNTMGKWQTVKLEVTDLFPCIDESGAKTCLKIATQPYSNWDEFNNFKIAMQREAAGDVEFYFWNIRFVKKIVTE